MRRLIVALSLWLAACAPAPPGPGAGERAGQHAGDDDWPTTGGDAGKSYHSPLVDIAPANVATLGLAWVAELGTNRVLEATPVVIDGVMYTSGVAGRAYAFDAATGKELLALRAARRHAGQPHGLLRHGQSRRRGRARQGVRVGARRLDVRARRQDR